MREPFEQVITVLIRWSSGDCAKKNPPLPEEDLRKRRREERSLREACILRFKGLLCL